MSGGGIVADFGVINAAARDVEGASEKQEIAAPTTHTDNNPRFLTRETSCARMSFSIGLGSIPASDVQGRKRSPEST